MADFVIIDQSRTIGELRQLDEGLVAYKKLSGKLSSAILVQKGGQLVYGNQNPKFGAVFPGLSQLFFHEQPGRAVILATAKARGFRLGRISEEAIKRARFWMGGFKSILARPTDDGERAILGAIRLGKKGQRIIGGRKGRGGRAASGVFSGPLQSAGEVRLNFRAVVTAMEINLRNAGRGFMGASWLHKRWRKLAQNDPRQEADTWRVLVNRNPRSHVTPLGEAGLEGRESTGDIALRITSYVPGVNYVGQTRGLFVKAIAGVRADLDTYFAKKHAEMLVAQLKGQAA